MSEFDLSKIPTDVMETALVSVSRIGSVDHDRDMIKHLNEWEQNTANIIALAILQERADCAQHAFRMRWAPSPDLIGTKNATLITEITTDWSQKIGVAILNRGEK